ncbi:DUF7504 family protein [Salinigranum halophilum]|jgi:KaiC/GvpD/RAD55 family RecA-like ATPase|uniref:DUF7504 family protein n=1 Tax=Salinigranum halophilum TaxID=2565931 RepID=UPI0010A761AA|nr:DUF835 domain-containing protein [Salinigranum halophilum]
MREERDATRPATSGGETVAAFRPGTNVLVRGPSLAGKRALALGLLAALAGDERPVVVSATADAASIRRQFGTAGGAEMSDDCYVVDAVRSQFSGRVVRTDGGDRRTWYASSPNDLTGLGISTTRALSAVHAEGGRPRVVVDSLSTLLQYNSLERVYRFLHVMNSRVRAVDGVTIQVIHADAHTEREVATLAHLFDSVVDVTVGPDEDAVDVRTSRTRRSFSLSELLSTVAGGHPTV